MKGPIINGEQYVPIVLHITERDGFGRPQKCDVMLEGNTAKLSDDASKNEFLVAFAKEELVASKTAGGKQ